MYAAIDRVFGPVHIANNGHATNISTYRVAGQLREQYTHGAERYYVDCPCCGKHNRLGFSYLYATKQKSGLMRLHLVYCHACGYPDKSDERWKLWLKLQHHVGRSETVVVDAETPEPEPIPIPRDWCLSLTCPEARAARKYLLKRDFDPEELAKRWKVQYADYHRRLVWPIYNHEPPIKVWGYQTRTIIDDPESKYPKYTFASGFQKSSFVYAANKVRKQPGPLVIVEGVTSVWRMQNNTVAVFGSTISPEQHNIVRQLVEAQQREYVVLYFDGNVKGEELFNLMESLRFTASCAKGCKCKVRRVRWQKDATNDHDPATLTTRRAWAMVAETLGMRLSQLGVPFYEP